MQSKIFGIEKDSEPVIDRTYSADARGSGSYAKTRQNAIGAVSSTVDGAVAAHKMESLLDSHFQGLNEGDKAIAMAHGYSSDANAAVKMQALTKATMSYQMQSVESGFLHSMSFDASTGELGSDMFTMQRGINMSVRHNVDYGGQMEYLATRGSTANERMVAAGFSSAGKDLVNNIFGLFGGKSAIRNLATARNGTLDTSKYTFFEGYTPAARGGLIGKPKRRIRATDIDKWKVPKKQPRFVDAEKAGGG
ncbi:hypothetical protein [Hydrogenimonas sp.]